MDSDPDIEFIEKDSGMSSLGGSKDETPERRTTNTTTTVATVSLRSICGWINQYFFYFVRGQWAVRQ